METPMEAVPSAISLWWSQIGQWQALMVVATLAAFFITLGLTGDTKNAVFVATAVATFAVIAAAVAVATFAVIAAFAVATFAVIAAAVATFAVATFAVIAAAVATFAVVDEVPGVSRKAVWLSYMGEFCFILLPMLWALRG